MSSHQARDVRASGHKKAHYFARYIGREDDYKNNPQAKKDVIDKNGDAHSVKSGKWWQIFLYRRSRLVDDPSFQAMNGIGQLMASCLDAFPEKRETYLKDKHRFKMALSPIMVSLKGSIQTRLSTFLHKSIFNGGEVQYLTIHTSDKNMYFVFHMDDATNVLSKELTIENSKARTKDQYDNQKVLFRIDGKNSGELEVRTDSGIHYREMKLRFNALKITDLLKSKVHMFKNLNDNVQVYGKAIKKFLPKHIGN